MTIKAWLKPEQVPYEYRRLLERAVIDTAAENKLEYELWRQDGPVSYLRRKEFDFERFVQIAFLENEFGLAIYFAPNLAHYYKSTNKRRTQSVVSPYWEPIIQLSKESSETENFENIDNVLKYFKTRLQQAWERSYYITPDMFDLESNL